MVNIRVAFARFFSPKNVVTAETVVHIGSEKQRISFFKRRDFVAFGIDNAAEILRRRPRYSRALRAVNIETAETVGAVGSKVKRLTVGRPGGVAGRIIVAVVRESHGFAEVSFAFRSSDVEVKFHARQRYVSNTFFKIIRSKSHPFAVGRVSNRSLTVLIFQIRMQKCRGAQKIAAVAFGHKKLVGLFAFFLFIAVVFAL